MKPSEFSNKAKGKKFKDVVSPLKQYPSFARVLSIDDSIKETHDILFTAKTNLVGTNTCKQEYKRIKNEEKNNLLNKDVECSCQSRMLDQTWQAVSSNEIMRATEISSTTHKLKDMCRPQAVDSSYEDRMILRQKSVSNGIGVGPDMCSEEEQDESTTRYIEVFTAFDEYSGTEWLYYVYEYSETKKGTNWEQDGPSSNFRIGRACVADINFRNIAEIPLKCADSDKPYLATYDQKEKEIIAVMKNGFICKWNLNELNREFGDMAMNCWNWRGCSKKSKFIHVDTNPQKKHCCKTRQEDSNDNCQVEYVTHLSRYYYPKGMSCQSY